MRLKSWMAILSLVVALFLPGSLSAQEIPKYEFTGTYSYTRIEDRNWTGWSAAAARNLSRYLGIVLDVGSPSSSETMNYEGITFQSDYRTYTIMAGPKITLRDKARTSPFVQLMFGAAHESGKIVMSQGDVVIPASTYANNDFAMSLAFGADYTLKGPFAIRGQFDYTGFRIGATTLSQPFWYKGIRLSIGLTFRLGSQSF